MAYAVSTPSITDVESTTSNGRARCWVGLLVRSNEVERDRNGKWRLGTSSSHWQTRDSAHISHSHHKYDATRRNTPFHDFHELTMVLTRSAAKRIASGQVTGEPPVERALGNCGPASSKKRRRRPEAMATSKRQRRGKPLAGEPCRLNLDVLFLVRENFLLVFSVC